MMSINEEMKSLVKYQHIISLIVVLAAGVTAWNAVQAQAQSNEVKIKELEIAQEKTDDNLSDIKNSVIKIETAQEFIQDDLQEIKALLIRSLQGE